ncbi:MAG: DsbA family protein [Alphaproteobacteria bacterium]|nr:DsbA family protein [Alphaproteobacteria bacterium]
MRFSRTVIALTGLFSLLFVSSASHAAAPVVPERVMGSFKAPITIQEFVSLTCSHCAVFHTETMEKIKKLYIDTGKVRFILRDFPLDGVALNAAAVARCMPAEQFYPFVGALYKNQDKWISSADPVKEILMLAKLGGLNEEKAKACLNDDQFLNAIVEERIAATKKYDIRVTPTFVINNGAEKIEGVRSAEEFAAVFDRLLAVKH